MERILEKLPYKENVETSPVLKQLSITSRALAELKGIAKTMPNQNILINAIMINEAKASSEIENIVASHDEIYETKTSYIEKILGVSERTALRYLNTLVDKGFLVSEKVGRERIYKNQKLLDIIKDFDEMG